MRRTNAKLIKRLAAVKETPVVPIWMASAVQAVVNLDAEAVDAKPDDIAKIIREARAAIETRMRLEGLPPAWPLESVLL